MNRSVPTNGVLPHLFCHDVAASIVWLRDTFGFTEHYRYGAPLSGAQLSLGPAWIMLKQATEPVSARQSLTIFVDDVRAHFSHTVRTGTPIIEDLHETIYGELQYGAEDPDGHHWLFSQHVRDIAPADWGATIAHPVRRPTEIAPMLAVSNPQAAIAFYEAAFGAVTLWHLDHVIAGFSVDGAQFFLAEETPSSGTRGPDSAGFTTVRIELFVEDPIAVHARAVAAGAVNRSDVLVHEHQTEGPRPIQRMLQGSVMDPFGHRWLIGKFLD